MQFILYLNILYVSLSFVVGGFVLTGGIIGFLFSRSPATLASGVLVGGALLFLSTLSLKVWRQGKSSLPFILGQAGIRFHQH